jgi:mono/diheme cytochrome c family protein
MKSAAKWIRCAMVCAILSANSAAQDGAVLFKSKCAPCHGPDAKGKPQTKIPSLLSKKVTGMSDADIKDMIASRTNGEIEKDANHTKMKQHLTSDEANALLKYIRSLQAN